jgi:hypothetical protein
MAGGVTEHRVTLNRKPRKRLETLVRRRSRAHQWCCAHPSCCCRRTGLREIAASLSVDRQVVRRWVKRYLEAGFDGLRDRPRSGRPPEIEHHVWQKLATVVVQAPENTACRFWLLLRQNRDRLD